MGKAGRTNRRGGVARGFTLIEMLVTVVLLSVLAALGMGLISYPVQGLSDLARRASLVDQADAALARLTRELRHALPNSVRARVAAGRNGIEFLNTIGGGRYRAQVESDSTGDPLVNASADTFDVLGSLLLSAPIDTGAAGQASCLNNLADCLVLYNTGTGPGDFDAYQGDNIATITAASATQLSFDNGGGFSFPFAIPPTTEQRFFVVDTPTSFVCDTGTGQLLRFVDYPITAAQPLTDVEFGVAAEVLAANVDSCQFSYTAGAGFRHGLVTVRLVLREPPSNERVALLHQVHVANVP